MDKLLGGQATLDYDQGAWKFSVAGNRYNFSIRHVSKDCLDRVQPQGWKSIADLVKDILDKTQLLNQFGVLTTSHARISDRGVCNMISQADIDVDIKQQYQQILKIIFAEGAQDVETLEDQHIQAQHGKPSKFEESAKTVESLTQELDKLKKENSTLKSSLQLKRETIETPHGLIESMKESTGEVIESEQIISFQGQRERLRELEQVEEKLRQQIEENEVLKENNEKLREVLVKVSHEQEEAKNYIEQIEHLSKQVRISEEIISSKKQKIRQLKKKEHREDSEVVTPVRGEIQILENKNEEFKYSTPTKTTPLGFPSHYSSVETGYVPVKKVRRSLFDELNGQVTLSDINGSDVPVIKGLHQEFELENNNGTIEEKPSNDVLVEMGEQFRKKIIELQTTIKNKDDNIDQLKQALVDQSPKPIGEDKGRVIEKLQDKIKILQDELDDLKKPPKPGEKEDSPVELKLKNQELANQNIKLEKERDHLKNRVNELELLETQKINKLKLNLKQEHETKLRLLHEEHSLQMHNAGILYDKDLLKKIQNLRLEVESVKIESQKKALENQEKIEELEKELDGLKLAKVKEIQELRLQLEKYEEEKKNASEDLKKVNQDLSNKLLEIKNKSDEMCYENDRLKQENIKLLEKHGLSTKKNKMTVLNVMGSSPLLKPSSGDLNVNGKNQPKKNEEEKK